MIIGLLLGSSVALPIGYRGRGQAKGRRRTSSTDISQSLELESNWSQQADRICAGSTIPGCHDTVYEGARTLYYRGRTGHNARARLPEA